MGANLLELVRQSVMHCPGRNLEPESTRQLLAASLTRGLQISAVLLALLFLSALVVMVAQVGFQIVPELASPNWQRIDPANGWRRVFGIPALLRGGAAVLKVTITAGLALVLIKGRFSRLAGLDRQSLASAVGQTWDLVLRLSLAAAAAFVVVGVIDYIFQRLRYELSLRMTREELKEEIKREEGDPHIKARIRKLGRELSQRRMMRDVPRATVVITNPIHLAIALRYDKGPLSAPRVVAKGAGHVAKRIVETARRHAVPVVERKPVAQALYKAVQVGEEIPAALYHAVAEVLAYVYRLRGVA
jgi:flagellar biosynthetic protein FlhB